MRYRARGATRQSAWIDDARGRFAGPERVCRGFWRWKGFAGCPAWAKGLPCTYPGRGCYLGETFRDEDLRAGVVWCDPWGEWSDGRLITRAEIETELGYVPITAAEKALRRWLRTSYTRTRPHQGPEEVAQCLNAGETADTLGWSPVENPHVSLLLHSFSDPEVNLAGHSVLFLSKTDLATFHEHFDERKPSRSVILSWSMGNLTKAERGVSPTLYLEGRLGAAMAAARAGWRVRWRLDPMGDGRHEASPSGWSCGLASVARRREALPEHITLGTLRGSGGRYERGEEAREARSRLYADCIAALRRGGYRGGVGLCKEHPDVIRAVLAIEPEHMLCNCQP